MNIFPKRQMLFKLHGTAKSLSLLCCMGLISGCTLAGMAVDETLPDRSVVTGSITKDSTPNSSDESMSDQTAIRNVVSGIDYDQWGKNPLPWANADTGSKGVISNITQSRKGGNLCRQFKATYESYSGASLYHGESCMEKGGAWSITAFKMS